MFASIIARSSPPATLCQPAVYTAFLAGVALRAGNGRKMFFYTYVLKSNKDSELYIGWTLDLKKRLDLHNSGKVEATKYRFPLSLVYYEACRSKEAAIAREKQLKTGFGRAFLKRRIK